MKTVLATIIAVIIATGFAVAQETAPVVAKSIGMLRLAAVECDIGLNQASIDIFQSGAEAAQGQSLTLAIFEAQQAEAPAMKVWNAAQWATFCAASADLAATLKLL